MKIYGNLICQNGVHEVLRAIESVAPIVDGYFVMDGGSTDGTLEVLRRYQKVYNLEIFERPYDQMDKQRNCLLDITPKDSWVISIDQDEKLNYLAMAGMRTMLENIDPAVYTMERDEPLTVGLPFVCLMKDLHHYTPSWLGRVAEKVFYYDRTLRFTRYYHTHLIYKEGDSKVKMLPAATGMAVLHYAFLDAERVRKAPEEIKSGKRDYKEEEWDLKKREVKDLDIILL